MHVNLASQEISCKLVFCGPGLSGKTTNLEFIHDAAPADRRGPLSSISTEGDRTLFFDYLPLSLGKFGNATTKFQIYTVPGQSYYAATRRLVLQGADGLVFVADSAPEKLEDNLAALDELERFLPEILSRSLTEIPLVLQWNKQDLSDALTPEALAEAINPQNRLNAPGVPAVAREGVGVLTTLKELTRLVLASYSGSEACAEVINSEASDLRGAPTLIEEPEPEAQPAPATAPGAALRRASISPPSDGNRCPWSSDDAKGVSPQGDPVIGRTISGCRVHAKLGEGGMGAVYLARHAALDKDVVIKVLKSKGVQSERRVKRFFREARLAARLEHPNIVAVQDVGTTPDGLHYLVMQYVAGENLHERIQRRGPHRPRVATRIILGVARALVPLHAEGVIHRDVKAENVVITASGGVKLIDFGLAKDLNDEVGGLTLPGALVGTPIYMAPEIGRVEEVDGRADVYSLGLTYYYLLTGRPPFSGYDLHEIVSGKIPLEPPTEEVPAKFRCVLAKLLAWQREARYATAEAVVEDLEALLRGAPTAVTGRAETLWRLTTPLARRGARRKVGAGAPAAAGAGAPLTGIEPSASAPPLALPPIRARRSSRRVAVPDPAPARSPSGRQPAQVAPTPAPEDTPGRASSRSYPRPSESSAFDCPNCANEPRALQRRRPLEIALAVAVVLILGLALALRDAKARAALLAEQAARLESLLEDRLR